MQTYIHIYVHIYIASTLFTSSCTRYICIYIYIYICICVYIHIHICIHIYTYMYAYKHKLHTCIQVNTNSFASWRTYTCMQLRVVVCECTRHICPTCALLLNPNLEMCWGSNFPDAVYSSKTDH